MDIFLEQTDTISKSEKYDIQEKLDMYDKLWEENPKVQRIRTESSVEGKVEGLQDALITTIRLRFPTLADLAKKQVRKIQKPDALDLLLQQVTTAQDEIAIRTLLTISAA